MSFNPSDYYYACTCRSEDPLWKYKAVLKRRTDDPTQPSDEQYVFFDCIILHYGYRYVWIILTRYVPSTLAGPFGLRIW